MIRTVARMRLLVAVPLLAACAPPLAGGARAQTPTSASPDAVVDARNPGADGVRVVDAGRVTLDGYDAQRRLGITLDGVTFGDPAKVRVEASFADVTLGPRAANLAITGTDVRVSGAAATTAAAAPSATCAAKFVPFPGRAVAGERAPVTKDAPP